MRRPSLIFLLLALSVFIYHFGSGFYAVAGLEPLPAFEFLYTAAFLCGVVWWLRSEAQKQLVDTIYCPGVSVGVGWFISIPYYLFKARGLKGFVPILVIIGCVVVGRILGAVTAMAVI